MGIFPFARQGHRARVREGIRLGPNEERYLLAEKFTPESYVAPWSLRIKGPLDVARLQAALDAMGAKHECFRTGFETTASGDYRKYIERDAPIRIVRLAPGDGSDATLRRKIHDFFFTAQDFTPRSIFRCVLFKLDEQEHLFVFSFHHTVSDGLSVTAFMRELVATYRGDADLPAAAQFGDFAEDDWDSTQAYVEGKAYWAALLDGFEPGPNLPEDRQDPTGEGRHAAVCVPLGSEILDLAQGAADRIGVSVFAFVYAVTNVALSRAIGSRSVLTTFQSHGRRRFPGSEGVLGCYSNALIGAVTLQSSDTIADVARRIRATIRDGIRHEAFPYHHIIREFRLHPTIGVNWFPELPPLTAPGLEISIPDIADRHSDYDLNFRFLRKADGLDLLALFRGDRVHPDRVRQLVETIGKLVALFAADTDARIDAYPSRTLTPPGSTPDPSAPLVSGGGQPIHHRFLEAAVAYPDNVALAGGGLNVTYKDLEARSRAAAGDLKAAGVGPGDRVAIIADRHPSLIWNILAVCRTGAVFVVLDSNYPKARLAALATLAAPKVLIATEGVERTAADLAIALDVPLLEVGRDHGDGPAPADQAWIDRADPAAPAYLLFTSGSTGAPKCIACSHEPLRHFLDWQAATFSLTAADRFTLLSGLSHDPLLRDMFAPLSLGATLFIPSQSDVREPGALRGWFAEVRPSVAHMTPPLGELLNASSRRHPPLDDLRAIFWGGDLLQPQLLSRVSAEAPAVRHVNFYGSTETPQAAAWFEYEGDLTHRHVPIGKGLPGFQLLIVDAARQPLGLGEVGEIAIRSNYLSLGYFEHQAVVPWAAPSTGDDTPIYFTGDRGLYLPDGTVMALGRQDDQVKIRGHRVDLSEVDAALHAHPAVTSCLSLAVTRDGLQSLVSFVVDDLPEATRTRELLTFVAGRLPDYMLPQEVRHLDTMPLLPNGKVDRMALREQASAMRRDGDKPRPRNTTEADLVSSWSLLLGRDVSTESSFLTQGGDSLSYVQVYLATEEIIGVVPDGWQFITIAELAAGGRQRRGSWTVLDSPLLIRAISITLVVAGHFKALVYGGGATTALFIVSGYLFGGLQLREAATRNSVAPILRTLRNVAIPTFLYAVVVFTEKTLRGRETTWKILALSNDLIDYSKLPPQILIGDYQIHLWYVDAMIKIILFLLIAFPSWRHVRGRDAPLSEFAIIIFVIGCATRFLLPGFFEPDFFTHGVRKLSLFSYVPTTYLATFALGMILAIFASERRALILFALTAIYALAGAKFFGLPSAMSALGAGTILIFFKRVALPRPIATLVFALSGASLFIYLTHLMFAGLTWTLFHRVPPWLNVAAALSGGAAIWLGWNWALKQFGRRREARRNETPFSVAQQEVA